MLLRLTRPLRRFTRCAPNIMDTKPSGAPRAVDAGTRFSSVARTRAPHYKKPILQLSTLTGARTTAAAAAGATAQQSACVTCGFYAISQPPPTRTDRNSKFNIHRWCMVCDDHGAHVFRALRRERRSRGAIDRDQPSASSSRAPPHTITLFVHVRSRAYVCQQVTRAANNMATQHAFYVILCVIPLTILPFTLLCTPNTRLFACCQCVLGLCV